MSDVLPVVVLGGTNVGKTTFFAVLDRALRDQKFALHAVAGSGEDEQRDASEFLYRLRDYITKGYFPPATHVSEKPKPLAFEITFPDSDNVTLYFTDISGEACEQSPQEKTPNLDKTREYLKTRCKQGAALLVLIDLSKRPEVILGDWRYTLEQFVDVAVRSGQIRRIAVLLTKADVLQWQQRCRQRFADHWIAAHPDLSPIFRDARSYGKDLQVRFFFSSAIGWAYGASNLRTTVKPRDLTEDTLEFEKDWADLIPDPAILEQRNAPPSPPAQSGATVATPGGHVKGKWQVVGKPRSGVARGSFPPFSDPLRLVEEEPDLSLLAPAGLKGFSEDQKEGLKDTLRVLGVLTLPGRQPPRHALGRVVRPWNIIEPLFWAANVQEDYLGRGFHTATYRDPVRDLPGGGYATT